MAIPCSDEVVPAPLGQRNVDTVQRIRRSIRGHLSIHETSEHGKGKFDMVMHQVAEILQCIHIIESLSYSNICLCAKRPLSVTSKRSQNLLKASSDFQDSSTALEVACN